MRYAPLRLRSLARTLAAYATIFTLAAGAQLTHAAVTWEPSGVDGGGFQNVLAIQPGGTGVLISGADVSGLQRSTDYGVSWQAVNIGTPTSGPSKIATVIFSNDPLQTNTVYAGAGDQGSGGGFFASTDGGQTWTVRSTITHFSGNGETGVAGLPGFPRSTGNLIAVDESGTSKYVYAGTFQDGMMRSTNGGSTWFAMGLSNKFIRGIAIDPASPWVVYAAAYSNKVWKANTARTISGTGTTGWWQLTGAPDKVEEMLVLGSSLYAVGTDTTAGGGVWKSIDGGTNWTKLGGSSISTSPTYTGINGYTSGASDVIYIGATDPVQNGSSGYYNCVLKSTDSGTTWTAVTLSANVHDAVGGSGGPAWWLNAANNGYMLGKAGYDVAMLQIDPTDQAKVFISGRSGVWGTTDGTASSIDWYPKVSGLSVTVCNWVTVDPNHPERVYVGDTDYRIFYSTNHGASVTVSTPAGADTVGFQICVDAVNSEVYAGLGNRDSNIGGEVFSNPDPTDPAHNSWTKENLGTVTGNLRPRGLVVGRDSTGTNRVILATVEGGGLYRKIGTGNWGLTNSTINPAAGEHTSFSWVSGSPYVYCFDQGTGVWRSSDYGATWTKIWAHASTATRTGYVVADPNTVGLLYISSSDAVYRATGANTGGTISPTSIGGSANPGGLALANGILYAADLDASGHNARLYQWLNPATSSTASNIADATIYPGQAGWPSAIAVSSDNYIYGSQNSDGTIVGTPSVPPQPTGLAAGASGTQISLTWNSISDASSYNVKRSTTSGGPYTTIGTATSASYTDLGLAHGTTYYYVVSGVNYVGEGVNSGQASAITAPATPTGLVATPGNAQVALTWSSTTGAATYNVKRSTTSGGPYSTIASPSGASYTDTGLSNGTTYYYVVSAVNTGGESANSSEASATPLAPLPPPFTGQDIGAVGLAGSSSYNSGTFTLTGAGGNIYTTNDAFYSVFRSWTGDVMIVTRVVTIQNTDPNAKAGLMIRASLASNAAHATTDLTPTNGVEFLRRYTTGGITTNTVDAGISAPYWLKLVRTLDSIAAFQSSNGTNWILVGSDTVNLAATVELGLIVNSHNSNVLCTATFDNFSVSDPWTSEDVGAVGVAGSATIDDTTGTFTVQGSGDNIYATADSFQFVSQALAGNGQIVARVVSVQNTSFQAKAGIMIREDLTAGAAHATVDVTPGYGIEFLRRYTAGGATTNTVTSGLTAPYWVKLVRSGSTVTASRSPDNTTWTPIGSDTITYANPIYIGLIVCSHTNSVLCTGVFDNVTVTPTP